MAELEIALEYDGPDIERGVMAVEDVLPVLQGFAGAYGKISAMKGIPSRHKLRLTAIRPSSAVLVLDVWAAVSQNAEALQAVGSIAQAALVVVTTIIAVIQFKKHTNGQPYTTKVEGLNGLVNVQNSKGVSISMHIGDLETARNKIIDSDLERIVKPLEGGHIDTSRISISTDGKEQLSETINAVDKPLFCADEIPVTSTKETWVIGQINSMTKSTNSGFIYLSDGSRVYFKLKADNPSIYYGMFGHNGLVRVRCIAHMDDTFRLTSLDIFEMVQAQPSLQFDASPDSSSDIV